MKYEKSRTEIFINRELSWLDFNGRVLDESGYKANLLLDRLNFISIFSSNLDEFFMLRVAGLRQRIKAGDEVRDEAGFTPKEQLFLIRQKVIKLIKRQQRYLNGEILPGLEKYNIYIRRPDELSKESQNKLKSLFKKQIFPILTPIAIDPAHPFPMFNNAAIQIVINLKFKKNDESTYAFVEVPQVLPRFIRLEEESDKKVYILLEELIMDNLQELFAQAEIFDFATFKIIRDMDFDIQENQFRDFLNCIEKTLLKCRSRDPICLITSTGISKKLKNWLYAQFQLDDVYVYSDTGPLALAQFRELVEKEASPFLNESPWPQLKHPAFELGESIFKSINEQGFISIFPPYHSFDYVTKMIEEAADDPAVLAIKQTLYRVGGDSAIVDALRKAAEAGKQVTAIVELKARFDEDNNVLWARKMEESGVHVIYGISGLKIHCKALIVIRREEGIIKRYVHVGTGNYNDKTARCYTDVNIFTTDHKLCVDISSLFNLMTGYSEPSNEWNRISVSPFNLREKFISMIDRETKLSTQINPGHIIAKMNSLVDSEIIECLYRAAKAGVKVDLIVRGICCLRPGVGTKNIRVISILDRFLEHGRIYYFANNGNPEYYISSADWMPRNLDRRIEMLVPVNDEKTCLFLDQYLQFQLNDKEKGRVLRRDGTYSRHFSNKHSFCRSQYRIYNALEKIANKIESNKSNELKIYSSQVFEKEI
jgi:polyphosphate kinase